MLRLTVAIVLSIGAVAGAVLATPAAIAAPTARAVAAAYSYDAAHNGSEGIFDARFDGTAAREPTAVSTAGEVSATPAVFGAADDGVSAATPVGRRGSPLDVPRGTNEPATIGGRSYGGHALDEMQSEGFTPSVVNDAIDNGQVTVGSSGRVGYYSPANNITVITESDGKIVTVTSGTVKIR